jgi:hypothetical protein
MGKMTAPKRTDRKSRTNSELCRGQTTAPALSDLHPLARRGRWRLLLKVGFDQVDRFANGALFNFELSSRLQSETEFHPTRQQYF